MHDDFRVFLYWLWKQLGLPEPTQAQYEIAEYLQHGPKRRIVMAFRGVGKSWITSAFVLWCLMRNPDEKVMVVSASEYKAIEFATFTKQLIATIDLLQWLTPNTSAGQRDAVQAFDVGPARPAQAPSVRAVGVGGQMTGGRATKIVFDDIEIPNNSDTEGKREKLDLRAREMGGAILVPGGHSIGLGTPQSIQTIYNGFEERGYNIRIWPARYPGREQIDAYNGRLAPQVLDRLTNGEASEGDPVDPRRFTEEDLQEREAEYGKSGFLLQFMLDTTLSDANRFPLKLRDLIIMDVAMDSAPTKVVWASGRAQMLEGMPNVGMNGDRFFSPMHVAEAFADFEGSVLFIDPAGRGRDETAYAAVKSLHGMLFLRRWGGLMGGYDESVLKTLAEIAKSESVNAVHVESNYGDGMFNALFSPVLNDVYPCHLEEYKVAGQKEARIIDKLEPVLNAHRLIVDKTIVERQLDTIPIKEAGDRARVYNGFYQLAFLTRERGSLPQDDRIDVLAEAVGYFTQSVARDVKKAEDKRKARLLEEALRAHQKNCRALSGRHDRRRWN
ncbi:phage terminase large subunit [Microbulbifer discodermiae]|uniref:phage terminase large subunit n=1 Tax=Microbulbifer sp. 2201CG32-9 TaxID=3232309 RepID=UPI00345B8F0B